MIYPKVLLKLSLSHPFPLSFHSCSNLRWFLLLLQPSNRHKNRLCTAAHGDAADAGGQGEGRSQISAEKAPLFFPTSPSFALPLPLATLPHLSIACPPGATYDHCPNPFLTISFSPPTPNNPSSLSTKNLQFAALSTEIPFQL